MIENNFVSDLAKKYQTTEENIWWEYCQHLFLSYFYQQEGSEKIYFKGGTALRIVYRSPRFSEDLDFSTSLSGSKKIEKIILGTLLSIEREGVDVELEEAKITTGGYLSTVEFKINQKKITVKIEISQRAKREFGELITISNDFILPYVLIQLGEEQLIEEKLQALLTRQKPRDFYDLYFLLRSNKIKTNLRQDFLPKILNLSQKTKVNFNQELKHFLPKSHWLIIRNFKDTLVREIKRYL